MEKRKHFWNGRWGRLARQDILLYEDAGYWLVENRRGGADGRVERFPYDAEEAALDRIRVLLDGSDGWREL